MVDAPQAAGSNLVLPEGIQPQNRATITHDEFLTLLIAELANQDPLAPMKSQEMASQLAQFGSLERLYSIDRLIGESLDVDLVILGSHGRSRLGHLLLGSVAEHTLRFAPCAVLVVKQ